MLNNLPLEKLYALQENLKASLRTLKGLGSDAVTSDSVKHMETQLMQVEEVINAKERAQEEENPQEMISQLKTSLIEAISTVKKQNNTISFLTSMLKEKEKNEFIQETTRDKDRQIQALIRELFQYKAQKNRMAELEAEIEEAKAQVEEMKQVLETQKLIIDSLKTKKEVSSILFTNGNSSSIQQYVAPVAEILIIERNIAYFNGDIDTVKKLDLEIKQRKHEIPERDTLNKRGKLYMERLRKELILRRNEEERNGDL